MKRMYFGLRAWAVFSLQLVLKYAAKIFYRFDSEWHGDPRGYHFSDLQCMILLNHTSLYEFLLLGASPNNKLLWKVANKGTVPVADITYNKMHGWLYRFLVKQTHSITRKRDETWDNYLEEHDPDPLFILAPEGRMKRPNGLDKHGNPMTLKGGIADVLAKINQGRMLIVYSGGLHHIAPPGCRYPKLFKTIRVRLETVCIESLKKTCGFAEGMTTFRENLIAYLTERQRQVCGALELEAQFS